MAVITPPIITPPPTRPDRADPATFANRADAWTLWERDNQVPEMAALGANVYANAVDAASSATAANASKNAAATSATAAGTSATNSANSATASANSATASANSATASDTARAAAVTARTGAETARTGAETARSGSETAATASMGYRDQSKQYRDEAQAITEGDIHGTSPTQFRNNAENDARFEALALTVLPNNTNWNTLTTPQKFILTANGFANSPVPGSSTYFGEVRVNPAVPDSVMQEAALANGTYATKWVRFRVSGETWGPWSLMTPLQTVEIVSNTTAIPGIRYILTTSLVLTLPTSPQVGDTIGFINKSGTTTATVNPGSFRIDGVTGVMTLDIPSARADLQFASGNYGWVFV